MSMNLELVTVSEASQWATEHLGKKVTLSNISYLIQYGKVKKYFANGVTKISKKDLGDYYQSFLGKREITWKAELGNDVNWALSFDYLKEADTTKHVHRLHPYKGKFIPQLVQYFIDDHIDEFKKEIYFKRGDVLLDPFCGSGTTLVQANEQGINAVGIDLSVFNSLISNIKIEKHNLLEIQSEVNKISKALKTFGNSLNIPEFERELIDALNEFNNTNFPSHEYKYKVNQGLINQDLYGIEKSKEFLPIYNQLVKKYKIELLQQKDESFLDKWYLQSVRREINFTNELIDKIVNPATKRVIQIILSRTIRSCRATTHSDLGTLIEPISSTYYCTKHGKICKPIFSIQGWWERYSKDTIVRLAQFDKIRTSTYQYCLTGDSTKVNILEKLLSENQELYTIIKKNKINGIFSSPPYVGLIDYHEQHAYAYELFGFTRQDEFEIGAMSKGQGKESRESYIKDIASVLNNCKEYLVNDYNIFLVANDKFNIYPEIAQRSGMQIVNKFIRPVLNRTERDKAAYSETIFHMKSE